VLLTARVFKRAYFEHSSWPSRWAPAVEGPAILVCENNRVWYAQHRRAWSWWM